MVASCKTILTIDSSFVRLNLLLLLIDIDIGIDHRSGELKVVAGRVTVTGQPRREKIFAGVVSFRTPHPRPSEAAR